MLNEERYLRQIQLKGFGIQGQMKLQQSRVLVIGAGGLGCPAIQYLAAMGVGTLGVCDGDTIRVHNLHRQILFTEEHIGINKATVACQHITKMNSQLTTQCFPFFLDEANSMEICSSFDLILDCSDRISCRHILEQVSLQLQKPWIFAAVYQYESQVALFDPVQNACNYSDLFSGATSSMPDCHQAGAFPLLCGITAMIQCTESIKWITGISEVKPQLLVYHGLHHNITAFDFPQTNLKESFKTERNRHSSGKQHKELSPQQLEAWLAEESCQLIDIREYNEAPVPDGALALRIPASVLHQHLDQISQHMPVVLICSSGVRTQYWVERLEEEYGFINISHLKGGWLHWQHYKQNTHE